MCQPSFTPGGLPHFELLSVKDTHKGCVPSSAKCMIARKVGISEFLKAQSVYCGEFAKGPIQITPTRGGSDKMKPFCDVIAFLMEHMAINYPFPLINGH